MKMLRMLCAIAMLFFILAAPSFAGEMPIQWPWRGININNLDGTRANIEIDKERLNVNSVRLEIVPRFLAKQLNLTPQEAWDRSMRWVGEMLDGCKQHKVVCIVAMQEFPTNPHLGIKQDTSEYWSNEALLRETLDLIADVARRFGNRGEELAAYHFLSEPLQRAGNTAMVPKMWPQFIRQITHEIRKHDSSRWVVVTPGPGGMPSGYRNFSPIVEKRIIYAAHLYVPHRFTHQGVNGNERGVKYPGYIGTTYWNSAILENELAELRAFQKKHDVPVWIGEFSTARWSEGGEVYLKDAAAIFNKFNWGWSYFSYGGYHAWNPDYNAQYAANIPREWKSQYVGKDSLRWSTLRQIFGSMP